MDSLALVLRVGLSLACVLGIIWLVSKGLLNGGARRGRSAGRVSVLTRQQLSRTSSVAVVRVGDRALVIGVTEQQITLLAETDLESVTEPEEVLADDLTDELTHELDHDLDSDVAGDLDASSSLDLRKRPLTAGTGRRPLLPRQPVRGAAAQGPLAGSALSPATWAQAVEVLRERTTRR